MGLMIEVGMGLGVVVVVVVDVGVDVEMDVWTCVVKDVGVELGVAVDLTLRPACVAAALITGLGKRCISFVFVGLDVGVNVEIVGLGVDVDMAVCVPVAVSMSVWISEGLDEDVAVVAREPTEPLLKNPIREPV